MVSLDFLVVCPRMHLLGLHKWYVARLEVVRASWYDSFGDKGRKAQGVRVFAAYEGASLTRL